MDLFDVNQVTDQNIKAKRIKELEQLILHHQKLYYTAEAQISDAEFDKLWDELKLLDKDNPILHKIGSDIEEEKNQDSSNNAVLTGAFEKVKHLIPMGSQEKAANPESFKNWANKMPFDDFLVEYKLDGASLEIQYKNGKFLRAVTRGDGVLGDDITNNVLKMKGLVLDLNEDLTGGVRGEVVMFHQVHKSLYPDKANCRNAANGLMKRKDGIGCENLNIICYDARFVDNFGKPLKKQPFATESQKISWLKQKGFDTVSVFSCKGVDSVIDYRAKVMELRSSLDYDIDGLVIKNDIIDFADADRNRPEKQIAFKFSLEEAISILREVQWSESGATYTPIAVFDTVELAGTKVSRASLANPDIMRELGVKIGSHIVVTKRGEIIPKIEYVIHDEDLKNQDQLKEIEFPTKCASCQSTIVDSGTRLYCPNPSCSKKLLHRLQKWIDVLDIRDLGETLIKKLFETSKVKSISQLYTLTEEDLTSYFLNEQSINKEKKSLGANKVVLAIQNKREVPLAKFIAGLDIESIGETLVEKLIDSGFDTLQKLQNATAEEIANVNFFGEITANSFTEGLKDCSEEIKSLLNYVTIKAPSKKGKLLGLSFCFTGELFSMKRSEAQNMVKEAGGIIKSSVVKGLTYLVTNDKNSGSSKNKKAQELGISVIDEKEFLSLF